MTDAPTAGRFPDDPLGVFLGAADALCHLAAAVPPDAWTHPALGEWTVRDLLGHASRALSTVEDYLGPPGNGKRLSGAIAYFEAASLVDHTAVAARGRQAGAALGDNPPAAVEALAARVGALVSGAPPDAVVTTAWGATMTLADYLPTRIFELAVHGLDLARAISAEPPPSLAPAVAMALELACQMCVRRGSAAGVLLALTGRGQLPPGTSVL